MKHRLTLVAGDHVTKKDLEQTVRMLRARWGVDAITEDFIVRARARRRNDYRKTNPA